MTNLIEFDATQVNWQKVDGMLPVVVQHVRTAQVLMLGYMNAEALAATLRDGKVWFYSRSKKRLWMKGETSGNVLQVASMQLDCDADTMLLRARPQGPTCHLGTTSCFGAAGPEGVQFLAELADVVDERALANPEESYTARLCAAGRARTAQKVGEEAVEVAIAAQHDDRAELLSESADLLFHLLVLWKSCDVSLEEVLERLAERRR